MAQFIFSIWKLILNSIKKNLVICFSILIIVSITCGNLFNQSGLVTSEVMFQSSKLNVNSYKTSPLLDPILIQSLEGNLQDKKLVDDEIFIKFNDGIRSSDYVGFLENKYGIIPIQSYPSFNIVLFRDKDFQNAKSIITEPIISSVWGNHIRQIQSTTKDSQFELNTKITDLKTSFIDFNTEINAQKLKEKGINGTSVTIAFLDTGVDITGQLIGGDLDDFDENTSTNDFKFFGATSLAPDDPFYYSDFSGRGTWHAGLACGTGYYNKTFEGVAPGAKYLSVKVFDPFGITYYSSLISGVEWAIRNSADIILFSADLPGLPNDPISVAINEAVDRGILVIAPSGNEGPSYMSISSPGHSLKALTVGAYDSFIGSVANFSSRGPVLFDFRQGIDLIAPGVGLVGTRAKILPQDTIETLTLMPSPLFGEEVQENYSRASGTGGASAIVAGAAALLLQEFPHASPEIIRIALTSTTKEITGDRSAEGYGLINVEAAYQFLKNYFEPKSVDVFPIPTQALYSGFISAPDSQNISKDPNRPENWLAIDSMISTTSHSISTMLIVNQTNFDNATNIHLLFSTWGIGYNGDFHWLPEFRVIKELYQSTLQPIGSSSYYRYIAVLSDDRIYVVMAIETWAYTDSQEQRINAYNFEFTVINIGDETIENLTLSNVCKADLYVGEYNISLDNFTNLSSDLAFANDDIMTYNETNNLLMATDSNQSNLNKGFNTTALAFTSSTHTPSQWEVGDLITIILNITRQEALKNEVNYLQGVSDPSWGVLWNLKEYLNPSEYHTFDAKLALGLGNSTEEAKRAAITQINFLDNNVTVGDVIDLQILEPSFHRLLNVNKRYETSTRILNVGTEEINQTEIILLVNRSNQAKRFELFVVVQEYDKIGLFEFFEVTVEWFPIYEDTYTLAWVSAIVQESIQNITALAELAGLAELLPTVAPYAFTMIPLITSYQARNLVVINGNYYAQLAPILARSSPDILPMAPMIPQFPGDINVWNITYIAISNISDVKLEIQGTISKWINLNKSYFNVLIPYTTIKCTLNVPLMAAPGKYRLNITFIKNDAVFLSIPLEFIIHAITGRVWFDAIHNNVTISISDEEIVFGWDERLDTPYGNFYSLKELWANPNIFNLSGTAMQSLMAGIDINLTDMGLDINELEKMKKFLPQSLKGFSFRGETLSTSYLDTNILQLGDILILSDPEVPYSLKEINNVTSYVNDGGTLIFLVEPENENNWTSINELLLSFGLEINGTKNSSKFLLNNQNLNPITSRNLSLHLSNPVSFKLINEQNNNYSITSLSEFVYLVDYGRGKVCIIGDNGLFNNTGLLLADNKEFAVALLNWALIKQADFEIQIKNAKIQHGEEMYFDIVMKNYAEVKSLLEEGYIWIYSFMSENGSEISPSSQNGLSISLNPIFPGEPGHFLGHFNSEWTNISGKIFIIFYFDHKALTSKIFFSSFSILGSIIKEPDFIYPKVPYSHLFDFVLLTGMVGLFLIQRQYRSHKWSRRFRITELKEASILYEARTYLAEAEMLGKSLSQAIGYSKYSELEKVRYLLRIRRKFLKLFDKIKHFGDKLGEV